jgi:hypothetical protein
MFIDPAEESCLIFCKAQIPQPAVDMQRIHIMLDNCGHLQLQKFTTSFKKSLPTKHAKTD